MHDRSKRRNVGGSQGASSNSRSDMSDFGKEFASFMGVDPNEAEKVVKQRGRKQK